MRSTDELRQLALDVMDGRVFGSWSLSSPEDLPMVFMVVGLAPKDAIDKMIEEGVVHFYEYIDKAAPRSVNGMPMFFSAQTLTQVEVELLDPMLEKLQRQREEFLTS